MKFNIERIEDIINLTRQLAVGLRDLTFSDNFRGFEETVVIPAGVEYSIRNRLNSIPNDVINKGQTGNGLITKGDTEWTKDYIYMKNQGAETVTVKLHFLK